MRSVISTEKKRRPAVVAFVGPPGSGKTSQIALLSHRLNQDDMLLASVPRLLRGDPELFELLTPSEQQQHQRCSRAADATRSNGDLAPLVYDRLLFSCLARTNKPVVLLDGGPRGARPAMVFLRTPGLAAATVVVHLSFRSDELKRSLARQRAREVARRGEAAAALGSARFMRKAEVYLSDTVRGLRILADAGVPMLSLDASLSPMECHSAVRELACLKEVVSSGE